MDFGERAFFILVYAAFVARLWRSITLQPTNILVIISESLVVLFFIIRRDALQVSIRPSDWLVALISTALPLFVGAGGPRFAPAALGAAFMLAGLTISIGSKLTLRRSFGVVAANRGLVISGPYAFIRHPIYAGYMLGYVGFWLNNPLRWNLFLYLLAIILLLWRIMAEERVLSQDPNFAAFMHRVPYRLIPGLF
jgi:protein-S-isoprenylcysteine O-methyltransferase Ste14